MKHSFSSANSYSYNTIMTRETYRIAGNFRWCKFSRKRVQTLQKKFSRFLFSRMRDTLATPLPVMATPHMRNGTERRNEEASLCNNGLIFLLCGGFFEITKVSRLPPRARNRRVGFSTADLDFDNFGVSHGFVGILYSSRLILLYSNHLEGRQTVENHLVHIGIDVRM